MAGAHAAHVAHAIANASKASGVIVQLEPGYFLAILKRAERPVVVVARGGVFSKHYRYLTSYKGLAFYTKSDDALALPGNIEVVEARKIWIPDM
jgi:hypothetical protein